MILPLTHERLRGAVRPEEVWRPGPGDLFAGITNPDARRVMTEIGIPIDFGHTVIFLDDGFMRGEPVTLAGIHEKAAKSGLSWEPPVGSDHWYVIADFHGEVLIDGVTGRLWRTPEGFAAPEPLHDGVGSFVHFMYAIYRDRGLCSDEHAESIDDDPDDPRDYTDVCTEAAQRLFAELYEVDPTPFGENAFPWVEADGFSGPWGGILEDIAGGQWGSMLE